MTVCDVRKKGRVTFTRVIRPPTGTGDGHFKSDLTYADTGQAAILLKGKILAKNPSEATALISDDGNNNHKLDRAETVTNLLLLPTPYNRLKKLRVTSPTPALGDYDPAFLDTSIFKE
jgi:hypothetical protein